MDGMNSNGVGTRQSFDSNRLSHAYIVAGGLAETLSMVAVCSGTGGAKPCMLCAHCDKALRHIHPDITVVSKLPDKREIVVEQIRELKKDVIVVPNEADKKAYIINEADSMNTSAQNAFLQILEEPPKHAVFILKTENPVALLPTVRSRCMELKDRHEPDALDSAAVDMAIEFFAALKQGNATLIAFMFRLEKLEKNVFSAFLSAAREQVLLNLRATMSGDIGISRETLTRTDKILIRAGEMHDLNVGLGHISGMICASLLRVES